MSKVLCIPDIHCRKFWREAINEYKNSVDKVIFLGDYIDPYPEEIETNPKLMEVKSFQDAASAIKMLEDIFSLKKENPDKYILLTGNHTDSYIWQNFSKASRTDFHNWKLYHNIFSENLNLFNFVWIENDVIFNHAGISKEWAERFLYKYMKYDGGAEIEKDSFELETARVLMDTPLENFNNHYINAISELSYYRGGEFSYGSCEWADVREHINHHQTEVQGKIVPLGEEGIFQVFGHTQLRKELITDKWACLDCRKGFIIDTLTYEVSEC